MVQLRRCLHPLRRGWEILWHSVVERGLLCLRCPSCGQSNAQSSAYCRYCGKSLASVRPVKTPAHSGKKGTSQAKPRPSAKTERSSPGPKPRRIKWVKILGTSGSVIVLAVVGFVGVQTYRAAKTLPSISSMINLNNQGQDSVIYDRYGNKVATLHGSVNRVNVPLNQIALSMQKALIDTEDHNFYTNPGFDVRSIVRAALYDLVHHAAAQGASTITEQLAKDLYLSDQKTVTRKIQEFIIGLELARIYSKQQILDMYLNDVYLGDGATGIYAAAHAYFNEAPSQLTLAQSSLLAGLPQAPSLYDPLVNLNLAKARQKIVLQSMVRYGGLSQAAANAAYRAPLHLTSGQSLTATAPNGQMYPYPWYIDQVVTVLRQHGFSMNQIFDGGLQIHTALDPTVYTIAQNAVDSSMNRLFGRSSLAVPNHQAAVMVESPQTGDVLAVIGGRTHVGAFPLDYATSSQVQRSTGSSIKPLIDYTPALAKGYTMLTPIQDVPIFQNVGGQAWWPQNDNHLYRGYVDLRDALAISDNDVAVKLLHAIGLNYGFNYAKNRFGLPLTAGDKQLGAAIGGLNQGVNVLDMTQAYATFPNGGVRMKPIWVTKVINQYGATVYQDVPQGTTVTTPQIAFVITKMMQWVLDPKEIPGIGPGAYATGYQLGIGRPAAGKTGTNNGQEDAWFMGYEPQLVVGVWEGDKNGEIPQYTTAGPAYGATAAGPIWQQIMEKTNQALHIPPTPFSKPSGVVFKSHISTTSGLVAGPYTPKVDIQGGWFVAGTQPTTIGHTHYLARVVAANPGQLWQPGCGPYITSVFLRRESAWHPGVPYPWDSRYWAPTTYCTPSSSTSQSPPASPSSPNGKASQQGKQPKDGKGPKHGKAAKGNKQGNPFAPKNPGSQAAPPVAAGPGQFGQGPSHGLPPQAH